MAREPGENKEHYSSLSKTTSVPGRKRPSKERGPFGVNNGTVQKEHVEKKEQVDKKKK